MIALEDVVVRRGGRTLINGISHAFAPGRITALLGANGAGKSTLVRLLGGIWQPDRGQVTWNGRDLRAVAPRHLARHRAVVGQHPSSGFAFRAIDLVLLGRIPHVRHPGRNDEAIAFRALDQVGLGALADRDVTTLSGGERQRVHLARALAQLEEARQAGHGVLILDEPTAHLDLAHQQLALRLARSVAADGVAVFVVLHDVNLAATHADQVLLLRAGRLLASGTPDCALTCPLLCETLQVQLACIHRPDGRPVFVPTGSAPASTPTPLMEGVLS
jgi:iron complex transport system ATP-binding protein